MIRCTQCGARKNRATDPCIYCGAGGKQKNRSKSKALLLSILIITLVATCVLLLAGFIPNDSSIEDLVDTWVSAINEDDAARLATVFPEIYLDGSNVVPDFIAGYLDDYRDALEEEYGEDFHVSAEILSIESADDSSIDLLAMIYEEADIEIKQSKSLEIELTIKGSGKTVTETVIINIIKVDGEWYFDILDSYFL